MESSPNSLLTNWSSPVSCENMYDATGTPNSIYYTKRCHTEVSVVDAINSSLLRL